MKEGTHSTALDCNSLERRASFKAVESKDKLVIEFQNLILILFVKNRKKAHVKLSFPLQIQKDGGEKLNRN